MCNIPAPRLRLFSSVTLEAHNTCIIPVRFDVTAFESVDAVVGSILRFGALERNVYYNESSLFNISI
jgi:cellulose biosynthesis protein BcsQ